ncbi:alpha/beta hydrolase [Bradyrhizobium sp. INPA01-394B]|uniref:Alpha/beta hydrolase n=1 Tax=Bradyrhizobium campsiandrae TaxID=1729892 RepID=A0ABR7UHP0_9BRAD|nr:alpha/beta hydrolase [Bradyrhizobium campsiandrae]MBC9882526.1 alpha/beta hydrolase [Bradyrhizobium campsiandrae]MBC9983403.1 alpha/beta hydrolase [Bradyrhizobium campsiandrae]
MDTHHRSHDACNGAGRNLARLRSRASGFFESLSVAELAREAPRHLWISDWSRIANDYLVTAETVRKDGSAQTAGEAWLCGLTALEVARSLACPGDLDHVDFADKVGHSLRSFADDAGPAVERVEIDGPDQGMLTGFFLPVRRPGPTAPVVICVSDAGTSLGSMVSRLLPASLCRGMSLLFVDAGHLSIRRRSRAEQAFQCWLDYLEARPDVDPQRIAIYGEGVGAAHASRLAFSDRRIAAAICDGGLATPVMRRAWLRRSSGLEPAVDDGIADDGIASDASRPSRRIPCPLLVVVGSRSMVTEQDALKLQAGYRQAGADCAVAVPNRIPHPLGEVENFVAVDDFIFEWLDGKLGPARRLDAVTYL